MKFSTYPYDRVWPRTELCTRPGPPVWGHCTDRKHTLACLDSPVRLDPRDKQRHTTWKRYLFMYTQVG